MSAHGIRRGIERRGVCLVIAAPSGGGKSSLARALIAADPSLTLSVSVTTRPPRPGERDGADYHFVSDGEFERLASSGALLEWAGVFGRCYGTPRAPVEQALREGRDVVFDIDWQGFRQMRASLPDDVVGVFLLPPHMAALEARLRGRGDPDAAEIARRMAKARDEMSHWTEFDHVLVNDVFEESLSHVRAVLEAARCETRRLSGLPGYVASL
jgi:guanylate kinase